MKKKGIVGLILSSILTLGVMLFSSTSHNRGLLETRLRITAYYHNEVRTVLIPVEVLAS